jgi:hypothetical protein
MDLDFSLGHLWLLDFLWASLGPSRVNGPLSEPSFVLLELLWASLAIVFVFLSERIGVSWASFGLREKGEKECRNEGRNVVRKGGRKVGRRE